MACISHFVDLSAPEDVHHIMTAFDADVPVDKESPTSMSHMCSARGSYFHCMHFQQYISQISIQIYIYYPNIICIYIYIYGQQINKSMREIYIIYNISILYIL